MCLKFGERGVYMTYEEALAFLQDLCKFGTNLGLERIEKLLEHLGNPHENLSIIHIAGTNGKGSTSALLASILQEAGYQVGLFTSPHLHSYRERVKINNKEISSEDFVREMIQMKEVIPRVIEETHNNPTEFEVLTALSLHYFQRLKVDFVILEVGMGGRLDSTNVVKPLLSVITPLGKDHMNHLGDTIAEIAQEKAGIFKENTPVVLAKQNYPEAREVFIKKAKILNSPIYEAGNFKISQVSYDLTGQRVDIKTAQKNYPNLFIPLLGDHQILNTATALACIELLQSQGVKIGEQDIYKGISKVFWPGRMEVIYEKPTILIDGAHNAEGIKVLVKGIKKFFNYNKLYIVLGILGDKDKKHMLKELLPLGDNFIVTKPLSPRAGLWEDIAKPIKEHGKRVVIIENINEALAYARKDCGPDDLICITGSLYLIGEARRVVLNSFPPA